MRGSWRSPTSSRRLTADRPYRAAMSVEAALAIMRESAGEHLASDVIEALADTVA